MLKDQIIRLLKDTLYKIEVGTCEMSDSEMVELMQVLTHRRMSKEEVCLYLNMCSSKFDAMVRKGIMPKGRKEIGFKEKVWYQDEIDAALYRMNKNK